VDGCAWNVAGMSLTGPATLHGGFPAPRLAAIWGDWTLTGAGRRGERIGRLLQASVSYPSLVRVGRDPV